MTTRAPLTFSCTTEFTVSSFFCPVEYMGMARARTMMSVRSRMGSESRSTVPKRTSSKSSMTVPPRKNMGARTNIRSSCSTNSTIIETSLVIRVTSEEDEKRSMFSKE